MPDEVRMSSAQDDIDRVRAGFDDVGHRIDHRLDALARRQQAERQNDRFSGVAELRLGVMRLQKREIRYTVRYDLDLGSWSVMHGSQQLLALFCHDDYFA